MNKKNLYCNIPGVTKIDSVTITENHSSSSTIATIIAESISVDIGDQITIDMGYVGNHAQIFTGYVKNIDRKTPKSMYELTLYDEMIRASDYFIVSSNPNTPFKRRGYSLEALVTDILALAGLTLTDYDPTFFILGVNTDVEVNLISVYDICKQFADIVTWTIWADHTGNIFFRNRKPFLMTGASGQPGDDAPDVAVNASSPIPLEQILDYVYRVDEKDLRNKVVVYGRNGIYAEDSSATSFDPRTSTQEQIVPVDFYKIILAALPYVDTISECQDSASYNLYLYNKLTEQANLTMEGNPTFHARNVYAVAPSVPDIDGNWYAYSVEHALSKSGYTTTMELRR